jgi:hypothetical protein
MINLMPKNLKSANKVQSPKPERKPLSPYPPKPKLIGLNDAVGSRMLLPPSDAVPAGAQQASDSVAAKPGAGNDVPSPSHQRPISSQSNGSNRSTRLTKGLRAGSGDLNHLIHKAVAEVERISPAQAPEQPQLPM